jgi:uncharacterized membrane protein
MNQSSLSSLSSPTIPPGNDRGFEMALGRLLRGGVMASSICFGAGLVMTLADEGGGLARALLAAGLVLLMATPVARVVVSAVGYARRRDWMFVGLTLVVFLELMASVVLAFRGSPR